MMLHSSQTTKKKKTNAHSNAYLVNHLHTEICLGFLALIDFSETDSLCNTCEVKLLWTHAENRFTGSWSTRDVLANGDDDNDDSPSTSTGLDNNSCM